MINTIVTSVALLAASAAAQVGRAVVINSCSYPVTLTNVPASGGGQNQIGPQSLGTGSSYSQEYTELSNGDGWSLKLSKDASLSQVLQYEYTFHNDGTIWYDLSAVNGDPFAGDWLLTGSNGCSPNQAAYLFPTDDAHGMQSCPQGSSVTVTLCGAGGGAPAPAPSGAAPAPSVAPNRSPPESQAPAASVPPASVVPPPAPSGAAGSAPPVDSQPPSGGNHRFHGGPPGEKAAELPNKIVTDVKTMVVTKYVTVSPSPIAKRDEHLHRHAAHHVHF